MNFTQMHERLRLELLRRIQRGTLSVSLLARQTGFGQSHISNFLRHRRQLSLQALDRVLASQHMTPWDLLPVHFDRTESLAGDGKPDAVPLVSHAAALFEPFIRSSSTRRMVQVAPGILSTARKRPSNTQRGWQRFIAVSIPAADSLAMEPLVLPEAIVLLDRHYSSLLPYRPGRSNVYAVRNGHRLVLRYVDFVANRLVLRPHNLAVPVELVEIPPGETPNDFIVGRAMLILNEL